MEDEKETLNYKIVVLGDSTVGKTSIILRYTEDKFMTNQLQTLGKND